MTTKPLIILSSEKLQDVGLWLWLWLVRRHKRFQVTDRSMLPLLKPGDEVLVDCNAYRHHSPQSDHIDDIIVIDHPQRPGFRLVKRVKKRPGGAIAHFDSGYWVEGDNTSVSTDSRSFGPVPYRCLVGKVVCIFRGTDR